MLTRLRGLAGRALDVVFGPHCPLGCGQRVYVEKDLARHLHLDHAGDPRIDLGGRP